VKTSIRCLLMAGFLIATPVVIVRAFQLAVPESSESPAATYAHGSLHVTIPHAGGHASGGLFRVEVLDPEDKVVGHVERRVESAEANGPWAADVPLPQALATDDLVWHRVRYRFNPNGGKDPIEGIESISQILRMPVLRIIAQQSYFSGGAAAIRAIVTDSKNEPVGGRSSLRIELLRAGQRPQLLFTGSLNQRGTSEAQFRFPSAVVGRHSLRYAVETAIGSTEFTQPVRLEDKVSILLTTEKPVYQPGQTIHIRALALDRADHAAAAGRPLTFEVEDSRGNKVFKKAKQTDKFGIGSAEFTLADEVNLGAYHVRALMDEGPAGTRNESEIAVRVERYVLPKFKVAIDFSGADAKTKHGYRPGDHVVGTVRANYFFGKPVDRAPVTVKASTMDVSVNEVATVEAKTTADGAAHFDLRLPEYFAGRPLSQGAARVLIEATVKDSANHSETRGEPITVSESPLLVTAVPESGKLVPNLENQVFVLSAYADGTPAITAMKVHAEGNPDQAVNTDAGGVAIVRLKAGNGGESLRVEASDSQGNRVATTVPLESRAGADQLLLRTERAVYRAGDRIALHVFSTKTAGSAYVDVVKDGQTILTRDLDLVNGQAELALAATPQLAGTLDINAYVFGQNAQPLADHRLVFVQPPDELKIEATADAAVYKPGDDAHIRFRVTNGRGEGVQAALGVQAVDEAVFALAEKQPGFAKVFFYLEQETMKPRYEIHSVGMPQIVEPAAQGRAEQRDRAARALFAATEMVNPNRFDTEVGRSVPQTKYGEFAGRYQARFIDQAREGLDRAYKQSRDLTKAEIRDAWENTVRVEHASWNPQAVYLIRSAGPDKRFDTPDDLLAIAQVREGRVRDNAGVGTIGLAIEHDRGPNNGLAAIAGSVKDATGGGIQTSVTAREIGGGGTRSAHTNGDGQFEIAAVPPGIYDIQIAAPGFQTLSRKVTLAARDRAVLSATLPVGAIREVVTVTGFPVRNRFGGNVRMQAQMGQQAAGVGGVVGGIVAGVMPRFEIGNARALALPMNAAMPPPPPPAMPLAAALKDASTEPAPRVRSYFPEALYINPEIITDGEGRASISIPLADSITTWRMALVASTPRGALGSGTSSLKVFQDFFVDLDLPVTLTQGDRVSLPVAAYNYSGAPGKIDLKLHPSEWFSLVNDTAEKQLAVNSGQVGGAEFSLEAKRIGKFRLTLSARLNAATGSPGSRADIVVREIEVVPNGREKNLVFNGRLESSVQHELSFPPESIPDASKVFVRLYPGPLSQVVEGMDGLLRMPFGCFEQTSSATYPNVLALDYMKQTKKLTPEIHAKAEGFIANGYQRLLTFEVPGGGFSWFGQAPANKILTSYGLMEFSDMAKVHDVDPRLIQRTQTWLASQQQADGSWKPDTSFINEGATNRYNSDLLRISAYIGWALENTGFQGPAVEKARKFVSDGMNDASTRPDPYTLAVIANFAADYGKDREFTHRAIERLVGARTEKDEQAWWTSQETGVYATGASAAVETTGLAVQALLKSGEGSNVAAKALRYIAAQKGAAGTWGTTQATIMALRALLLSTEKSSADVQGTVEITLNGRTVHTSALTPENDDLFHQFVLASIDTKQAATVGLRFTGKGGLAYQVVGRYFVPWNNQPENDPLSITVGYDRTRLAQDDIATATATIRNNLPKAANMVMVDLGIPPGFDLLSEDLQAYQENSTALRSGRLQKFSMTATQAILYFDSFAPGDTVKLKFRLRAKYPIRARTFQSRVYEYYDPEVASVARPVQLEVSKR
jgi:uncharacterized protein YfaS (alpha-2-macroglobulin family)